MLIAFLLRTAIVRVTASFALLLKSFRVVVVALLSALGLVLVLHYVLMIKVSND
jgi:hypothetical protein